MIQWRDFEEAILVALERDIRERVNQPQHAAVRAPASASLFVVAGPGSGKTTVVALRILKLIMVDGVSPSTVLATTFTRKAASELRSRILGWGDMLREALIRKASVRPLHAWLESIDLNQALTGTLDSICEELLTQHRPPGAGAPVVLEDFVAKGLMLRAGLFQGGRHNSNSLKQYVGQLQGSTYGLNASSLSGTLREIRDRIVHDRADVAAFCAQGGRHRGVRRVCEALEAYGAELNDRGVLDFSRLEEVLFEELRRGSLAPFLASVRFLLVDEYQDTNLLQEDIYFSIARSALRNGGSLTVVGDDDQSLYRFRGATVDLFQGFSSRVKKALRVSVDPLYLTRNYRSTNGIVRFVNEYVSVDAGFKAARVRRKPPIVCARAAGFTDYPVLGMFRDDPEELADALAGFVRQVVGGRGASVPDRGHRPPPIKLSRDGSAGDIAFLVSSPLEYSAGNQPRLPLLLRQRLATGKPFVKVFNPRGQSLEDVESVGLLCGLILECVDPDATVQNGITRLPNAVRQVFDAWRERARKRIRRHGARRRSLSLGQFVAAWQARRSTSRQFRGIENVSINDLIYKLVTWVPEMQDDVEQLVYLETVTRAVAESALFGSFGAEVIFRREPLARDELAKASVREALWNVLVPIATGAVEVNEDLMLEALPGDRLNMMSVHQAKGLEFPLVIVDVGSDFKRDHPSQAFKRFPRDGGRTCNMEDALRKYSRLGVPTRSAVDRAFDDLVRQYFVAFSRAQDVLLLVGLTAARRGIPNVATGWDRRRTWHWGPDLPNLIHI